MDEEKVDVHAVSSAKKGIAGVVEGFIRKFRTLGFIVFLIPLIALSLVMIGLALFPGVALTKFVLLITAGSNFFLQSLAVSMSVAIGFFMYGISIIFLAPAVNFLLPLKVKPWRGNWHSNQTIPWYIHNALTYIVRYTFLDLVTPTPLNLLFYRMMGMKIGKGVVINTSNISDPCLITLDDYVTIGGSASLMAHYGQKGFLILANVHIKKGANIGLKSSIMGDVVIGENATVKPHSVVLPKTRVADGETV